MTNAAPEADRGPQGEKPAVTKSLDHGTTRTGTTATTAQVAPLPPRIDDFHVGHIVGGQHGEPVKATNEAEERYIPVALARAHLARVVEDMHTMKQDQATKMAQIVERYKTIEAETKAYYESYITELKRKAKEKFRVEQARFTTLEAEQRETQLLAHEEIHALHLASDHQQQRHEYQKALYREQVETSFVRYEEELTRLHVRVEREIQTALERQAETMGSTHRDEVARLQQSWDDARAESVRIVEQTRQELQRQFTEAEAHYETQLRSLQRDADVALGTFKCLATVVNRVVDMDAQTKRRKRSRELHGEIEALGKQAQAAAATERALEAQLRAMKAEYDAMEQRAVGQTMDVLVRTVEFTPAEQKTVGGSPLVVVPIQEPTIPRPQLADHDAQTTEWAALLAAHAPARAPVVDAPSQTLPSAEMCDATVGTEAIEPQPTMEVPPVPALPSATQLQYEADAERFRERNAELLQSKNTLKTLKAELQVCLDRKNDAKARIKQWLADFEAQHARGPTIEEKAQVKDLYLAFKVSEEAYNAAKARVADAKAHHHERVVEIEALSQWHALAASARGSSRGSDSETRPGTAASSDHPRAEDDPAASPPTVPPTAAASLEEVNKLAKEIDELRAELKVAQADKVRAHDDAQRAVLEAKQAKADAKETADRLALAEAKALEAAALADAVAKQAVQQVVPAKAEEKESHTMRKDVEKEEEDRAKQEAEARRQHEERVAAFERETQSLDRERAELQASIAGLRDEIAVRALEKQALETQIEQLRLHAELMDGHDDEHDLGDDALASDAKVGAHEDDDDDNEEANDEEEVKAGEPFSSTSSISEADHADGAREAQLVAQIKDAIEAGKALWNRGDKAKCFQLYVKTCEKCLETLRAAPPPSRRDEIAALKAALQEAGRLPPAKGSMVLRRQLDACLAACGSRAMQRAAAEEAAAMAKTPTTTPASSPQRKTPHKKSVAPASAFLAEDDKSATPAKALDEARHKLKALETKAKADKVRITQLETSLAKAETQLLNATASGASGGGGANTAILERKLAEAEKKHAKALDEAEKALKRELAALTQQLGASQSKSQSLQDQVDKLTKELSVAGGKATQLSKMEEEVALLRAKAAQVDALGQELSASKGELAKLETSYKEEQALRKKYYNMIEDMKGKIRVYARCRPMSSSETERGCESSVRFLDEFSLELQTSHGPKTFAYDQVFPPASTQEQVFEDTKNLLQSAVDGYNVCIFAYGQTGSGKTFTMTGSESLPGLSPRAIHHLFKLAEDHQANHTITFQACMLELYNDTLIDLFYLVDGGGGHDAPKLDIKKNDKGMVFVSNLTTKSCASAQQTLKLFEAANKKRQVGATKMNAESSRSHSVFSLLVENYNKTTKTTSLGKLSLVDLAGSERAGKTGATNDRLKEAQAINKSLSALGDVIAALSAGEKFIPYRNNKLTQLMQDSLGGNAKTLMFVNISPADYNQEETQTSLQYASRVKLITNNANKTSESETVNRLKQIIKQLRAGKSDVELDGLGID